MALISNKPLLYSVLVALVIIWVSVIHFGTSKAGCENFKPEFKITTKIIHPEPVFKKNVGDSGIRTLYVKQGWDTDKYNHEHLPSNSVVPAITIPDITYDLDVKYTEAIRGLKGKACSAPTEVILTLTLKQSFFLNRESYSYKCEFDAAIDHEMKHMKLNKRYLEKSKDIFEKEVLSTINHFKKKYGPGPHKKGKLKRIQRRLERKSMKAAMKIALLQTKLDFKELRLLVDTPEEYKRIQKACVWKI